MANIAKLKGITDSEAEALRMTCQIATVEDLWLRISGADNALQSIADSSGIEKKRLIHLLAAEGSRQTDFAGAWLKRHWSDLLILLVALCLAILIWRRF
jgi:hypothetical protein